MKFFLPRIDLFSFLAGIIFTVSVYILWILIRAILKKFSFRIKSVNNGGKKDQYQVINSQYLSFCHFNSQQMHFAFPLFQLDDIAIEPRLMIPQQDNLDATGLDEILFDIVPYLPDWPELSAKFNCPTISMMQALDNYPYLVITGQAGAGKSFALSYLASTLSSAKSPGNIPFLIRVNRIPKQNLDLNDPLSLIVNYIGSNHNIKPYKDLRNYIQKAFSEGKALLLFDGIEEVDPDVFSNSIEYLKAIKRSYPHVKIITTSTTDLLTEILKLDFFPITLASWRQIEVSNFMEKWGNGFSKLKNLSAEEAITYSGVDPLLIHHWIMAGAQNMTPLGYMLFAWGCFEGDLTSNSFIDLFRLYIIRLLPDDDTFSHLENLALETFRNNKRVFPSKYFHNHLDPRSLAGDILDPEIGSTKEVINKNTPTEFNLETNNIQPDEFQSILEKAGIIFHHETGDYQFANLLIQSILLAKLNLHDDEILKCNNPYLRSLATGLIASNGLLNDFIAQNLELDDLPFETRILTISRWMENSPNLSGNLSKVNDQLINKLMIPRNPFRLRGQFMVGLLLNENPQLPELLLSNLSSEDVDLVLLSILGLAFLKFEKAIDELAGLLSHPHWSIRSAACLGLALIGSPKALDHLGRTLLNSDDRTRRAAAEALALNPREGYAMLAEGIKMDDLHVRKAVVLGLRHIDLPWALELLTKVQIEDDQWLVRNAASAILDDHTQPKQYIQSPLPPPSESPWLISYAGKFGKGISPNSPVTDILLQALKEGTRQDKLSSMQYLQRYPTEEMYPLIYQYYFGEDVQIREAAFSFLWFLSLRGLKIPPPQKYGY